ncbi:MAG: hypothetical protein ABH952_00990 [Candidatus Omnitrophota bacterium]
MKKGTVIAASMLLVFLSFMTGGLLLAQEDNVEYSWGIVKNVSAGKIVVVEYDYNTDEEMEVSYVVNSAVTFNGVQSLQDISADDELEIEYVTENNKRIAKVISVDKQSGEEALEKESNIEP